MGLLGPLLVSAKETVLTGDSEGSSRLMWCWQSSFSCGCITKILILMLAIDWELLSAPRGPLKSLAAWPPQAIHSMAVCFLPGQQELVSLKLHLQLKVKGSPDEVRHTQDTFPFDGQLISGLILGVVSHLFTSPVHTQGLIEGMHRQTRETRGHFRFLPFTA